MIGYRSNNLLALAPDGQGFAYVQMRAQPGGSVVRRAGHLALNTNPLSDAPELVGRELRERLDDARVSASRTVLVLSASQVLAQPLRLPELGADDLEDYVAMQAEKHFCFPPDEMALGVSSYRDVDDGALATLAAVRVKLLNSYRSCLSAADLTTVAATVGASCITDVLAKRVGPTGAIMVDVDGVDLAVSTADGTALVRRLATVDGLNEDGIPAAVDEVVRSLRIALSTLGRDLREAITEIPVFGVSHHAGTIRAALEDSAGDLGVVGDSPDLRLLDYCRVDKAVSGVTPHPGALAAAMTVLGDKGGLQFIHQRRRRQVGGRTVRRTAAAVAAGVLLIGLVGFAIGSQHLRLRRLERRYAELAPKSAEVDALRTWVKEHSPWFTDRSTSVEVLRTVTEAFPESGDVWVTSLGINEENRVFVSGKATSRDKWLDMQESLRERAGVRDLRMDQVRSSPRAGEPMTYSLSFIWRGGTD